MKNKDKKGFTLIEIIVAMTLIAIIGGTSLILLTIHSNKTQINELMQIKDKILLAAEVYIETNSETHNQLYEESNGVKIPLSLLVNEGLLDISTTKITKNTLQKQFVLAAPSTTGDNSSESGCTTYDAIASFDPEAKIYICLNETKDENYIETINTYEKRISELEQTISEITTLLPISSEIPNNDYVKGINPANYVYFEVTPNTSAYSYFPNDSDKNLWRVLYNSRNEGIKLVYNKAVKSNNSKYYKNSEKNSIAVGRVKKGKSYNITEKTFYRLNYNPFSETSGFSYNFSSYCNKKYLPEDNAYYIYNDNDMWTLMDVLDSMQSNYSKKKALYNQIVNKDYIVDYNYKLLYINDGTTNVWEIATTGGTDGKGSILSKIGTYNSSEIESTKQNNVTWLYTGTIIGGMWGRPNNGITTSITSTSNGITGNHPLSCASYYPWPTNSDSTRVSTSNVYLYGSSFVPVITLKSDYKLIKNTSEACINKDSGTKECPYLIG